MGPEVLVLIAVIVGALIAAWYFLLRNDDATTAPPGILGREGAEEFDTCDPTGEPTCSPGN